eukprot:gene6454-13037_t
MTRPTNSLPCFFINNHTIVATKYWDLLRIHFLCEGIFLDIFENSIFVLLAQLEGFDEVCDLEFHARDPVQTHEFLIWERKNAPFKLPSDFKSFYSIFNGIILQWKVSIGGKKVLIGDIRLNPLDSIQKQTADGHSVCMEPSHWSYIPLDPKTCTAFALDPLGEFGQIMLIFRQPKQESSQRLGEDAGSSPVPPEPEVWFLDVSSRWHYLCATFTHLLRIAVVHMGIAGWQLAYTPEGLSDCTQNWMRLFCRERLCIDIHHSQITTTSSSSSSTRKTGTGTGNAIDHRKHAAHIFAESVKGSLGKTIVLVYTSVVLAAPGTPKLRQLGSIVATNPCGVHKMLNSKTSILRFRISKYCKHHNKALELPRSLIANSHNNGTTS